MGLNINLTFKKWTDTTFQVESFDCNPATVFGHSIIIGGARSYKTTLSQYLAAKAGIVAPNIHVFDRNNADKLETLTRTASSGAPRTAVIIEDSLSNCIHKYRQKVLNALMKSPHIMCIFIYHYPYPMIELDDIKNVYVTSYVYEARLKEIHSHMISDTICSSDVISSIYQGILTKGCIIVLTTNKIAALETNQIIAPNYLAQLNYAIDRFRAAPGIDTLRKLRMCLA